MRAADRETYDRSPGADWYPVDDQPAVYRAAEPVPATSTPESTTPVAPDGNPTGYEEYTDPDTEGWAPVLAGAGGLIALGAGVWLFVAGGWAAIITASAVLAVAGGGTAYAIRENRAGRRIGLPGRSSGGSSSFRSPFRFGGRSRGRGGLLGARSRSGGSGIIARAARGLANVGKTRAAGAGSRLGKSAAARQRAAAAGSRARTATAAPAGRTIPRTRAPAPGGSKPRPSAAPKRAPSPKASSASPKAREANPAGPTVVKKRKVRRIPRRWLLVGGAAAGVAFLGWQARRRHARWTAGNGRQPNAFQWWLMGLMDRFAAFIREATADRRDQDPIRVDATTGEPSRPHPGTAETTPDLRYADANVVDVDAAPATNPPPTRAVTAPNVRDDERDGDAWTKGGAPTIPARHRQEYTAMSSHPYVEQLVEGFNTAFGAYRPNVDDGTDVIEDLEHHTLALAAAFADAATVVQGFADWIQTAYPSYPGLADYFVQISNTLQFASAGGHEAAAAHRSINAAAFELREGGVPNPHQANIPH